MTLPSNYPLQKDRLVPAATVQDRVETTLSDVIGRLRYLADHTRPDLLYPLSKLGGYTAHPSLAACEESIRTIRYLKKTLDYKLVLGGLEPRTLFAMSDSSFGTDNDCKSQLGYCIFLGEGSGAVYSVSKAAQSVSLSSTQSEADALVECMKEVLWFQGF